MREIKSRGAWRATGFRRVVGGTRREGAADGRARVGSGTTGARVRRLHIDPGVKRRTRVGLAAVCVSPPGLRVRPSSFPVVASVPVSPSGSYGSEISAGRRFRARATVFSVSRRFLRARRKTA